MKPQGFSSLLCLFPPSPSLFLVNTFETLSALPAFTKCFSLLPQLILGSLTFSSGSKKCGSVLRHRPPMERKQDQVHYSLGVTETYNAKSGSRVATGGFLHFWRHCPQSLYINTLKRNSKYSGCLWVGRALTQPVIGPQSNLQCCRNWASWYLSITSEILWWRQGYQKFKVILSYATLNFSQALDECK